MGLRACLNLSKKIEKPLRIGSVQSVAERTSDASRSSRREIIVLLCTGVYR